MDMNIDRRKHICIYVLNTKEENIQVRSKCRSAPKICFTNVGRTLRDGISGRLASSLKICVLPVREWGMETSGHFVFNSHK